MIIRSLYDIFKNFVGEDLFLDDLTLGVVEDTFNHKFNNFFIVKFFNEHAIGRYLLFILTGLIIRKILKLKRDAQ